MEKKKFKLSDKVIIIIGLWLMVIGVFFVSNDYFKSKKQQAYETITFALSDMPEEIEQDIPVSDEELTNDEDNNKQSTTTVKYNYIGKLEIPKINLKKGFVSMDSPYNQVNLNVTIIKPSDYPDVVNGNFILASHNGNGWNSYFRNLYKLKVGDMAYVTYNDVKYEYKIVNIYKVKKTGTVSIFRDFNKTTLTLITCTKGDKKTQTVFILERTDEE